jgi:hypothetical protein
MTGKSLPDAVAAAALANEENYEAVPVPVAPPGGHLQYGSVPRLGPYRTCRWWMARPASGLPTTCWMPATDGLLDSDGCQSLGPET